jgi:hypothetical protein
MNGGTSSVPEPGHAQALGQGHAQPSQTSPSGGGFVAVNARQHHTSNGHGHGHGHSHGHGTSSSTRHELLSKFHTLSERRPSSQPPHSSAEARRPSLSGHGVSHPSTPVPHAVRAPSKPAEALQGAPPNAARPSHLLSESELHSVMNSPVPIPNTPSSLLLASSQRASQQPEKDDGGPFKVEMVHRMESLAKGDRIIPPCDRCRRLHMDCLKNLTACMGCTKKHAKCSWKEVREGELRGGFTYPPGTTSNGQSETSDHESHDRASTASPAMLSPPRHHLQSEQQPQQPSHHDSQHDSRIPSTRNSPPERERERDRNVETQLQEAAQSSLAHANARLGNSEGKNTEYPNQTMVA